MLIIRLRSPARALRKARLTAVGVLVFWSFPVAPVSFLSMTPTEDLVRELKGCLKYFEVAMRIFLS